LNGILGFTDLALNASDQQVQRDYLGKIEASGRLMLDLVNDVLDMSKIESGKMELHPQSFATRGLFSSIVDAVRLSAEQQGVKLISHLDTSYPLYISVDRLRLQQIVLNLLSNAIKYTPEGGTVEFEVRKIAEDTRGCNTLVRVADTGIGMSAEFQKRMFEPFSQEHQSRMYGMQGTGLGLAIVRNIVELMDGFIEVDSALAEGTAISVYLPIVAVQTGEDPVLANVSSRSIAGKRILLCEDNDLNAEIAEVVLRERGHAQVDRARDGKQGVQLFEASAPGSYDAVLMDLRMPVMDGIDATRAIRALDRPDARRVPILAMTADAFAEDAQRCLAAGMNAHLSKPLDPKRLIDALSQMCNGGDA
jgi:CheY-like chemotaxis protein